MLRLFLLIALFLSGFITVNANSHKDTVEYFNYWGAQESKTGALYYRKTHKADTLDVYIIEERWMKGNLKMTGEALDKTGTLKTGVYTYYYENGNKSNQGLYYSDYDKGVYSWRNGKWKSWYEDGKPKEEEVYIISPDYQTHDSRMMSYWDKSGQQLVVKGNGKYYVEEGNNNFQSYLELKLPHDKITISGQVKDGYFEGLWLGYTSDNRKYCEEEYSKGQLVHGKSWDSLGREYVYDTVTIHPRFPGGDLQLMKFLQGNITYPVLERNNDIQGKVLTRFTIKKDGSVADVKVLQGVSPGLDAEAVRVIKALPIFLPARKRGQLYDCYFNLPVVFRLQ